MQELRSLLHYCKKLPYIRQVKESDNFVDTYSLASERSLAEDWLLKEEDELPKLYRK
jgi:hypothetical protein